MRPRQRRFVVPSLFALLALVLGWAAVRAGGDRDLPAAGRPTKPPLTPVLSARRVAAFLAAPAADTALQGELAQIVAQSPEATCLTVSVGGRVVYQHNPDVGLVPASAQKLVTATAALAELDPEGRLRTRVLAASAPSDGVVPGDLWMVGGGDPLLATKPYLDHFEHQPQVHTSLEALADAVKAAGVTRVQGRIVGDDSRYDRDRYPDAWPQRYLDQNQSGPLSALSVNDGYTTWPARQMEGAEEETAATDPPAHAAATLQDLLGERGVTVEGTAASGQAPEEVVEIARVDSRPMRAIVGQMLNESDNQTAELLVKELGRKRGDGPTTDAGVAVVAESMRRLGLTRTGTGPTDGSGLDEGNRTTCALLMHVLDRAGPTSLIGESLAVAGETGTLAERFATSAAKGRLRAKTGTLNTVTALAGFATARQGPVLTFAYVANGQTISDPFLALQEAMGDDLVAYPQGPPRRSGSHGRVRAHSRVMGRVGASHDPRMGRPSL
ncbi:MAG: D-alanyl-D-alanine carboxypeptidase/D-alanyl-D-alanine-endopeptidase [Acidimicrobiales bacterium]